MAFRASEPCASFSTTSGFGAALSIGTEPIDPTVNSVAGPVSCGCARAVGVPKAPPISGTTKPRRATLVFSIRFLLRKDEGKRT